MCHEQRQRTLHYWHFACQRHHVHNATCYTVTDIGKVHPNQNNIASLSLALRPYDNCPTLTTYQRPKIQTSNSGSLRYANVFIRLGSVTLFGNTMYQIGSTSSVANNTVKPTFTCLRKATTWNSLPDTASAIVTSSCDSDCSSHLVSVFRRSNVWWRWQGCMADSWQDIE